MRRARRGYVLMEAMAAGAVLGFAMAGLLAGMSQAGALVGRAVADQTASQVALEQLERLRALPLTAADWSVGTTPCLAVVLQPGWTCTVDIAALADAAVAAPVTGPLSYQRARVTVTYRGDTWTLETFKW